MLAEKFLEVLEKKELIFDNLYLVPHLKVLELKFILRIKN